MLLKCESEPQGGKFMNHGNAVVTNVVAALVFQIKSGRYKIAGH
jgi:hypothetical protein